MTLPIAEIKYTPDNPWGKRLLELELITEEDGTPITAERLVELDLRSPLFYDQDKGGVVFGEMTIDGKAA